MLTHDKLVSRFEAKFTREPSSGCWLWTAATHTHGYGKMWDGETVTDAHRLSWTIYKGEIPKGMHVLHKCDVPCCVNPDHLFIGTHQDNMYDMNSKGRHVAPRGAMNSHLTQSTIDEIRAIQGRLANGEAKRLALHYGISTGGLYKIRRGDRWGEAS